MNKKQKIYLVILVALVIVFMITKMNNNVENRIRFFKADSAKIATIEIADIKDTIRLAKKNNSWKIVHPFENVVNEYQINNLFSKVLTVKTSALPISENEESFDKFQVTNSQGTLIKFIDKNDKILDEAIIGKSTSSSTTPARRLDDNKIYELKENITYIVTAETDKWREKNILEIEEFNISKISVISEDKAYELTPSDSVWHYKDEKSNLNVDLKNKTLTNILTTLTDLRVIGFIDNKYSDYQAKLSTPALEIGIEMLNGSNHYIRVSSDEKSKYVLQLDNDTEFLYSVYQNWIDKFNKEAIDFK